MDLIIFCNDASCLSRIFFLVQHLVRLKLSVHDTVLFCLRAEGSTFVSGSLMSFLDIVIGDLQPTMDGFSKHQPLVAVTDLGSSFAEDVDSSFELLEVLFIVFPWSPKGLWNLPDGLNSHRAALLPSGWLRISFLGFQVVCEDLSKLIHLFIGLRLPIGRCLRGLSLSTPQ